MTSAGLKSSYLKKKVGNLLFFNRLIRNAKAIQFLTKNEYEESKDNFAFNDYYFLGNGIELPKTTYSKKIREVFKIVFIGRYNVYHKGLDVLLKSINNSKKWFVENNVCLEMYGSDSDNGLQFLNKYIEENNLNEIIKINGPIFGKDKMKVLLDSDVFIHTSRLEGQPTSIIEAISYGIPVIVTPGTNMQDVVKEHRLGFICKMDCEDIFKSIKECYESKDTFEEITKRSIEYAKNEYDWEYIARKSIDEYRIKLGE